MDYSYKAKLGRVVDGDTVWLDVDLGFNIWAHLGFRLEGINTPEVVGPALLLEMRNSGGWAQPDPGVCLMLAMAAASVQAGEAREALTHLLMPTPQVYGTGL